MKKCMTMIYIGYDDNNYNLGTCNYRNINEDSGSEIHGIE